MTAARRASCRRCISPVAGAPLASCSFATATLRRPFTLDVDGRWDGTVLTLDEDFRFAKGETLKRQWCLRKLDEHRYEATAADLVRPAVAEAWGNAFYMRYDIWLPWRGRRIAMRFDDWSWLQENGVLINVATISKFGIRLGGLTGFFERA